MSPSRVAILAAAAALALPGGGAAKSTGACPSGGAWELVTVASLGFSDASGIPSLDGNGDGLTCIAPLTVAPNSPVFGGLVFRDNTVQGP